MAEPTFTPQQVQEAIWTVLDQHPVSLLLDQPQDTTTPSGHLHPEDVGHVARWVAELLHRPAVPDGP